MSKASTSSLPLRYLLRQLYLAKAAGPASSSSALEAGLLGANSSSGGRNHGKHGDSVQATSCAPYSTSARAASVAAPLDASLPHATVPAGLTQSASSSGNARQHVGTSGSAIGGHPSTKHHRYARHGHRPAASSSPAVATSNLLPSFWVQPSSASGTPPPPVVFSATPHASSSAPSLGSLQLTATSSANTSLAVGPSSSSHSSEPVSPTSLDRGIDDQHHDKQLSHSSLTLHPGAYGIPKRLSANGKGKEREFDLSDPVQAQISQMQQSLLSVQVGEDAYFVRNDALGVADGVGGWSGRKGADPGLFAARLMHHCSAELASCEEGSLESGPRRTSSANGLDGGTKLSFMSAAAANSNQRSASTLAASIERDGQDQHAQGAGESSSDTSESSNSWQARHSTKSVNGDPIEVMHRAWDLTLTEFFDFELIGSSTALLAMLKDDELRLANIGDCCCGIIRGEDYIFRSQEQQHSFNYPFQMGTNSKDTPRKDGQRFSIKVQKDDIVILSSDGLVDNLFDEDILEEVLRHGNSPERISKALCSRAKAVSEDQRAVTSPFQQRANEEGIHFVGGKHDDISVLVAIIGDKSEENLAA